MFHHVFFKEFLAFNVSVHLLTHNLNQNKKKLSRKKKKKQAHSTPLKL